LEVGDFSSFFSSSLRPVNSSCNLIITGSVSTGRSREGGDGAENEFPLSTCAKLPASGLIFSDTGVGGSGGGGGGALILYFASKEFSERPVNPNRAELKSKIHLNLVSSYILLFEI
jgi:hypothetical protein